MKLTLRTLSLLLMASLFFACGAYDANGDHPDPGSTGGATSATPAAGTDAASQAADETKVFLPIVTNTPRNSAMRITAISDNRADYPGGQVPQYEKFELTFQVEDSVAQNFQFPYDPAPPPGIDPAAAPYQGISVDAHFTPDNWQTTYVQPAFYYQDFLEEVYQDDEWYYPSGDFAWKVRFAPHQPGAWQVKLTAQDASGVSESTPLSFTVVESSSPGFVKVSPHDPRYFEFDNGDFFPALGYNMNYNAVDWINPVSSNEPKFQKLSQNRIQLVRTWLSQWAIFTSAWNPWNSIAPVPYDGYIPFAGLSAFDPYTPAGSETSMIVNHNYDPCMFLGFMKAKPAVKPNTTYRVRVRYMTEQIQGPRLSGPPYGLVVKLGGWLWGEGSYCHDPYTGVVITNYESQNTIDQADPWRVLEGTWNSGTNYFLPNFYIAMENVNSGRARIDYVWVEEVLGGGAYGVNILPKPWMSHHLYFEQLNSYAFDKVVELAHQYGVYLRPVILEKNEWTLSRTFPDGSIHDYESSNDYFYGEWRAMTKTRWLEQAWWRYLQARWGYSTNIHSWELINEGDPFNSRHYALADEFGKFMHCRAFGLPVGNGDGDLCTADHPNAHLVSTSNWHSFPAEPFWGNADFPNLDFADTHAYISTGWLHDPAHIVDAAAYHVDYSRGARNALTAALGGRPTMPIVRGEGGIDSLNEQEEQPDLALDYQGVWLHNFTWSNLHPSAMIEQYWWTQNIETQPGPDGSTGLHEVYKYFYDFIADIPLNNGHYQDAAAVASDPQMRLAGQVDRVNQRAHLWVQNRNHTWRNVVDGVPGISGLSGTVTIEGFAPNTTLSVEWHEFTTQGTPSIRASQATTSASGTLTLSLPTGAQITDVGIKIGDYGAGQ